MQSKVIEVKQFVGILCPLFAAMAIHAINIISEDKVLP